MLTTSLEKILKFSWKQKTITAKQITNSLGLEKSTVSRNISKLREKEILLKVNEISPSSLGGRKTIVYSFNKEKAYVLGISIEQDGIEVVKTNLFSEIIYKKKLNKKISKENITEEIDKILKTHQDVIGVGISIPGIVKNNTVIFSEALNLKNFNIVNNLNASIPMFVEKDSLCGAIRYSLKNKNIIYFQFSIPYYVNEPVGFGVGLVLNGKPYYGNSFFAGEYKLNKCIYNQKIPLEKFFDLEVNIDNYLQKVSEKIGVISSVFDPEIMVIGGNITLLPQISHIKEYLMSEIYMINNRNIEIKIEDGREFVNAEGAAINVLNTIFSNKKWLEYFYKKVIYGA
ncbi:ROK family transcriptional regulator [Thermosipho melanesiensis]|uniref:ROK family protein n=2 Tax=Thermosipho melanesiensis TaxID=46541 RepID=A6LKV1_THEM4|nr:ROK family transcriptional regulator [Thermosipho melanesiensis]ABR30552.1 ROK family protein [Thermosipho melanesiensis BI429]APT73700.1 ROK family transcriptional regulator [Thermosipho melanesiensis]OOC35639.1 ROK family transcriptional regulator [Thermosipho melanesiensis]OOC39314.1 ROK family transcriptional regulator [Thermosipho melanesiensis]OOC39400.1 ROK family transcriptional regulator [Thermosipho melanesiensis]